MIIEGITNGTLPLRVLGDHRGGLSENVARFKQSLTEDRQLPKVRCDSVAAVLLTDPSKAEWRWSSSSLGPQRLPFSGLWFEWEAPPRILTSDGWENCDDLLRHGFAYVEAQQTESDGEVVEAQTVITGYATRSEAVLHPLVVTDLVNAAGEITERAHEHVVLMHKAVATVADESELSELEIALADMTSTHQYIVRYAVGLMNCRNVSVELRDPPPTSKRSKRAKGKRFSYHVIKLPAPASAGRDAVNAAAGPVAMHIARGHFKTYTEEAPLFGTRVGTYWWNAHVRGNAAVGRSDHDYEVREP